MSRDYDVRKTNKIYVSNLSLSVPPFLHRLPKKIYARSSKSTVPSKTSLSNKRKLSLSLLLNSNQFLKLRRPSMSMNYFGHVETCIQLAFNLFQFTQMPWKIDRGK